MTQLLFDEQSHTYSIDSQPVLSVTQILKKAGLIDVKYSNDTYMIKGHIVHSICDMHDNGILDISSVDERLTGYLAAWKAFIKDTKCKVLSSELRIFDIDKRYAGTIDKVIKIDDMIYILDIKTGTMFDWMKYQVAGYASLYADVYAKTNKTYDRIILKLNDNGNYSRPIVYTDTKSINEFQRLRLACQ